MGGAADHSDMFQSRVPGIHRAALMVKAQAISSDASPVEGDDKIVGANVQMKIRF